MKFNLKKSIKILTKTPSTLEAMLADLSDEWIEKNEGEDTWSPYDVIGHLIHGEKTDWMVRVNIIMSNSTDKSFVAFDRFAQISDKKDNTIGELLKEFRRLRVHNLSQLKTLNIQEEDYSKKGMHPELGEVNLQQLLSTWTVHDLGHISQISRVMAKQYKSEVGPWINYLGILKN